MEEVKNTPIPRNRDLELEMQAPSCAGGESFALMVLGHSMAPEFLEGEIIIIEPEGLAKDGSYVIVHQNNEWIFRQLKQAVNDSAQTSSTQWILHPLNPNFNDEPLASFSDIKGVIIQKALPGRRRASKFFV